MVSLHAALVAMALSGSGQTVMLDFYADWCGPCRAMGPTIDALAAKGYPIRRVNIDRERDLANHFSVTSIPCFVMLVNGQEVDRVVESTSFSRLERMCQLAARADGEPAPWTSSPPLAPPAPPKVPMAAEPIVRAQAPQPAPLAPLAGAPLGPPAPLAGPGTPMDAPFASPPADNAGPRESVSQSDLVAASVRLRVEDKDGRSCGSGTIIDNRHGEALVLTCGHLFRDSQGKGAINVDLFSSGVVQTVPGRLISYSAPQSALDLSPDVGLVAIRCPGPVVIARLAPPEYRVREGMAVVSVGCNNGELPTARPTTVSRLNRFNGPPNIEVADQPVEGRSGGGLFSPEGYVIGICNAADPESREGYFGAAASAYAALDRGNMAFAYQSPAGKAIGPSENRPAGGAQPANAVAAALSSDVRDGLPGPGRGQPLPNSAPEPQGPAQVPIPLVGPAGAVEQTLLAPGVLPGMAAGLSGRVIVIQLDKVSAEFLEQLATERRRQEQRQAKQLAESRPRRKLLEWPAGDGALADRRSEASPQLTRTSLEQRTSSGGRTFPAAVPAN